MKLKPPTEEQECISLVAYLDILVNQGKVIVYTCTNQETFTRSWGIKMKNKRMGLKKGLPDYVIVTPDKVIFIEMKRAKKSLSKLGVEQKQWNEAINKTGGHAFIAYGYEEAKKYLERTL